MGGDARRKERKAQKQIHKLTSIFQRAATASSWSVTYTFPQKTLLNYFFPNIPILQSNKTLKYSAVGLWVHVEGTKKHG